MSMEFAIQKRDNLIKWIKKYFEKNGTPETPAIIGVSGGKDSTIAAALLVRALGKERVIGVLMPDHTQEDFDDAVKVCDILGITKHIVNIGDICDTALDKVACRNSPIRINLSSRIRMSVLYCFAEMYHGRVANTCNSSEEYVGYLTKFGDGAGDFSLFKFLLVKDVLEIGETLPEIPSSLVFKTPSDGLCGKTDEENLGFSYETLDNYLCFCPTSPEDVLKIEKKHKQSVHKDVVHLPAPELSELLE